MTFKAQVLIHPGLENSGEEHWQTEWEKQFPAFVRVPQKEWNKPVMSEWIKMLDETIMSYDPANVIVVAHSLACSTFGYWAATYRRNIKGALLVGPSDTEAKTYPAGTTGFSPMPMTIFSFPSVTVISADDVYVSVERATLFANAWGSEVVNIGNAGHINADSKFGLWEFGLTLLRDLDR
jgi:uncharacterized protein